MTELLSDIETPSDAELISCVRGGDVAAYGELFSRHIEAANRLARQLARGPDADDLVSEAFAKVLQVLQGGGGPDVAFRAYLLTSVRRLHVDRIRAGQKLQTSDDMTQFDPGIPFQDTAVADFENGAAAKAFASLPERWQLVLWHLEVEGQKPADIAPLLGMSANSVSALAYRAREGLRQAFLTMHLADISAERCRWVNERLGAYVRKGLSRRDTTKVEEHLDECRRCTAMYLELTEVNSNLAGIIAPLLLGAAAAGYLGSSGTATAGGVLALVGRARDVVVGNATAATAGAVAASVAAVATAGFLFLNPAEKDVVVSADAPIAATSPNAAPAPELPLGQSPAAEGSDETPNAVTSDAPGAVAPIGDLLTTETPSAVPSGIPSTATTVPGALPGVGPGPGIGTGDGPVSDPGVGPDAPGTPGTGGPGGTPDVPTDGPVLPTPTTPISPGATPTVPGPAIPVPSIPGPSVPAPTEPSPSVPAPSVPAPSTEVDTPPVTTPGEPSLPPADLRLGNVSVDVTSGTLSIPLTNLPPGLVGLTVDLESAHTTLLPDANQLCDVELLSSEQGLKTQATCAPFVSSLGAGQVTSRMVAPSEYTLELPLSYPEDMGSDELTVTVTADGHEEMVESDNSVTFTFKPVREHDFRFTGLHQVRFLDGDDTKDTYHVLGRVSDVPDGVEQLSFSLSSDSGQAEFMTPVAHVGSACDFGLPTSATCTPQASEFNVEFVVTLPHGATDQITIDLVTPTGFIDRVPANDMASTRLVPVREEPGTDPAPDVDIAITDLAPVGDSADNTFEMVTRVTGAPEGVNTLTFEVHMPGGATLDRATAAGQECTIFGTTVVCTDVSGDFGFSLVVTVPGAGSHNVTVRVGVPVGYTDTDTGNNENTLTLLVQPSEPAEDLRVEAEDPIKQGANVQVPVTIGNIDPDTSDLYFWVEDSDASDDDLFIGVAGCGTATNGGVQCPVEITDGTATLTLDFKQPPGQAGEGARITLFVSSIGFDASTAASVDFTINTSKGAEANK
ncbi:MAG TPA: sigma-70 family RNA polymerase sigma factor [Nocardioidaceae bacterium]|nr:sigma-70 family RNA polymerase sigma factor [Nocardioidaceae bacterium]